MYFPVKGRALINVPKVFLNLHLLRWVTKYKYLGTILTDDLSDDSNMLRQRGTCYARCNSLIRNFSSRPLNVKVKLFKTFSCIMYCCQIWSQYKKGSIIRWFAFNRRHHFTSRPHAHRILFVFSYRARMLRHVCLAETITGNNLHALLNLIKEGYTLKTDWLKQPGNW